MMFQEHIVEMLLRHISNAQPWLRADKHILQLLWEGREMARWGDKWEGTPGCQDISHHCQPDCLLGNNNQPGLRYTGAFSV